MAQNITLYGTNRVIPETAETGWGQEMTADVLDIIRGLQLTWLISQVPIFLAKPTSNLNLAAAATITQATPLHLVSGSGAITLNTTTPITAGLADGQIITLMGDSSIVANTVTLTHSGNVKLNGNIVLGPLVTITLCWNLAATQWWELGRNN